MPEHSVQPECIIDLETNELLMGFIRGRTRRTSKISIKRLSYFRLIKSNNSEPRSINLHLQGKLRIRQEERGVLALFPRINRHQLYEALDDLIPDGDFRHYPDSRLTSWLS